MKIKNRRLLFFFVLLLEACTSSQKTTFYLLKSIEPIQLEKSQLNLAEINVFIKPVTFPEYLDRPLMVYRESEYKLQLSEYNRWAGSLKDNFTRVFIENLSTRIAPSHVLEYSGLNGITPEYHLSIDVIRMDVDLKKQAVLKVKWTLMAGNKAQWINRYQNVFTVPYDNSYESGVEAQSKAVALFSDLVAKTIRTIRSPKVIRNE